MAYASVLDTEHLSEMSVACEAAPVSVKTINLRQHKFIHGSYACITKNLPVDKQASKSFRHTIFLYLSLVRGSFDLFYNGEGGKKPHVPGAISLRYGEALFFDGRALHLFI